MKIRFFPFRLSPNEWWSDHGGLPDFSCGIGAEDTYGYLSVFLKTVSVEEWSHEWTIKRKETEYQGKKRINRWRSARLSIHMIMKEMIHGYRHWDGDTNEAWSHISHDHKHLPALLLLYCEKTGRDPNEIKRIFLNRELNPAFSPTFPIRDIPTKAPS